MVSLSGPDLHFLTVYTMKRWNTWKQKNWHPEWKETSWWEGNDLRPPGVFLPPLRTNWRRLMDLLAADPYTALALTGAVIGLGTALWVWFL